MGRGGVTAAENQERKEVKGHPQNLKKRVAAGAKI